MGVCTCAFLAELPLTLNQCNSEAGLCVSTLAFLCLVFVDWSFGLLAGRLAGTNTCFAKLGSLARSTRCESELTRLDTMSDAVEIRKRQMELIGQLASWLDG